MIKPHTGFRPILRLVCSAFFFGCTFPAFAAAGQEICTIQPWLPQDYVVFHVGTYAGTSTLPSAVELDSSGHTAKKVDVVVNYPAKPVVLVLTAYDPVVWNVGWAPGSKVVGVFISGYHPPAIIGIPRWIPLLRTSYQQNKGEGPCPGIYNSGPGTRDAKAPWTKTFTGKEAERSIMADRDGPTWIGEKDPSALSKIQASDQYSVADFAIKRAAGEVRAGPAGVEELVAKGHLRHATTEDFWLASSPATIVKRVLRWKMTFTGHGAYVVRRKTTLPDGMYGAHSAIFIVPRGIPKPDGPMGHNTIYLAADGMKCVGPGCHDEE